MTYRTVLALTASSLVALPAAALAQDAISYETGQYEYAQPLPELDNDVVTETITETVVVEPEPIGAARTIPARQTPVFVSKPTIQPIDPSDPAYYTYDEPPVMTAEPMPAARTIPARAPAYATPVQQQEPTYVYIQQPAQVIYVERAPVGYVQTAPGGASRVIYRDGQAPAAPVHYGYGYQPGYAGASTYLPAGAQVVAFDRNAWLDECRARLDTYETDSDRGEIIGALVGAGVGGLIGNRVAGSGNRTAGTLIGAGAGALVGMAAGDAIEDRNRARRDSYGHCEAYLDDYMQRATANATTTQYTQGGQYMLVPVTVQVPQRAVYRDGRPGN